MQLPLRGNCMHTVCVQLPLRGNCTHCTCILPSAKCTCFKHMQLPLRGNCMCSVCAICLRQIAHTLGACILPSAKCMHLVRMQKAFGLLHAHFKQRVFIYLKWACKCHEVALACEPTCVHFAEGKMHTCSMHLPPKVANACISTCNCHEVAIARAVCAICRRQIAHTKYACNCHEVAIACILHMQVALKGHLHVL